MAKPQVASPLQALAPSGHRPLARQVPFLVLQAGDICGRHLGCRKCMDMYFPCRSNMALWHSMAYNGLGPGALQELSQLWGWKMPKWHRLWRHRHHALSPGQAAPFVPGVFPGFALHGGPHGYRSPWLLLFYGSVQISLEVIFGWRAGWLRKGIDWRHVYICLSCLQKKKWPNSPSRVLPVCPMKVH